MYGDDLVVFLALIAHFHHANRPGIHDRQRHHRFLAEDEGVERVVVVAICLRDESVIRRIVNGTEEHTIDANEPAFFVELVLRLRTLRHFDDDRHELRRALADGHIVPGMHRASLKQD